MPNHHENPHQENLYPPKPTSNPTKFLLFLFKCFIMACILSLFLIFLGFAAIVLLHFLFVTTAFRRHHHHHHRRTCSGTRMVNRVNLPEFVYDEDLAELEKRDCAICLEGLREGEVCRSLPPCLHLFHKGCVDNWLMKVPNCPVCRTRVGLGDQERTLVMSDDDWKIWWAVGS